MKRLCHHLLLGCCLLTACTAMLRRKADAPVMVQFSLYEYPWNESAVAFPIWNEWRLNNLLAEQPLFNVRLDIRDGLPVSAFSKQFKKDAELVTALQKNHTTHVWDDVYLNFLPHNFYHRVGWIDWYLVRRDSAGKLALLQSQQRWGPFGRVNLLRFARNGDEIVGAWGF